MMRLFFYIHRNVAGIVSGSRLIVWSIVNNVACFFVLLAGFRTLFIDITKAVIGIRPRRWVDLCAFKAITVILFTRNKAKTYDDKYNNFFHKINFTQKYRLSQCQ